MRRHLTNQIGLNAVLSLYHVLAIIGLGANDYLIIDAKVWIHVSIQFIVQFSVLNLFVFVFGKWSFNSLSSTIWAYVFSVLCSSGYFLIYIQPYYLKLYFLSVLAITILPLAILIWINFYNNFKNKLELTTKNNGTSSEEEKVIKLTNPAGKLLFEACYADIILFQANDNYVVFHYLVEGNPRKTMERISLKKIESILIENDIKFYRIHKSFIANPDFIIGIAGSSQAHKLKLRHLNFDAPVSRAFDLKQIDL